jgi:hypothetical protein
VDEMKRPYSTHGESEDNIQTVVGKPKKQRVLVTDRHKWRIILKCFMKDRI